MAEKSQMTELLKLLNDDTKWRKKRHLKKIGLQQGIGD